MDKILIKDAIDADSVGAVASEKEIEILSSEVKEKDILGLEMAAPADRPSSNVLNNDLTSDEIVELNSAGREKFASVPSGGGGFAMTVSGDDRSWDSLPLFVLDHIYGCLNYPRDLPNFSLVCKHWYAAVHSATIGPEQIAEIRASGPLLLFAKRMYDPDRGKNYSVNKVPFGRFGVAVFGVYSCAIKLFAAHNESLLLSMFSETVLLYNLLTKKLVMLPYLVDSSKFMKCMCFAPPNVVVVREQLCWDLDSVTFGFAGGFWIDFIEVGDSTWRTVEIDPTNFKTHFELSYSTPILLKQKLYALGEGNSSLFIYDLNENSYSTHLGPDDDDIGSFCFNKEREQYLLESNGDLFAVFVAITGSWVQVYMWSELNREWEKKDNLGNRIFFVSLPYSLSKTVEEKEIGNRIYFPRFVGNYGLFYSLDSKKFHTAGGFCSDDFDGTHFAYFSTWIRPVTASSLDRDCQRKEEKERQEREAAEAEKKRKEEALERAAREATQRAALEADQALERQRKEELERQEREAAESEKKRKEEAALAKLREEKALSLGAEPEKGPDVTQVLLCFPSGERKERRFHSNVTIQSLYDYVDSLAVLEDKSYSLISNFPRTMYVEEKLSLSLKEAKLHPQASLIIELH